MEEYAQQRRAGGSVEAVGDFYYSKTPSQMSLRREALLIPVSATVDGYNNLHSPAELTHHIHLFLSMRGWLLWRKIWSVAAPVCGSRACDASTICGLVRPLSRCCSSGRQTAGRRRRNSCPQS